MKLHIGVDKTLGLIHSLTTRAANEHDIKQAEHLLHGKEKQVLGDAGYCGIEKREAHTDRKVEWHIAMPPGKRAQLINGSVEAKEEKEKASVRAKVEHAFFYIKRMFGYNKVRYRGLEKNTNWLFPVGWFCKSAACRTLSGDITRIDLSESLLTGRNQMKI